MIYLAAAIVVEIGATTWLRQAEGFSRLLPSIGILSAYGLSFALLGQALKTMEVGIAYAIWSGVGTAVIAVIGILAFDEGANAAKAVGICLVIAGVVVLNLAGSSH